MGLGSEISQICAMYYLNEMDHFIKEHLHVKAYARYNDDFYLIHPDIEYLKYCLSVIYDFAASLGLTLNQKRTRLVPLSQPFTYLKKNVRMSETGKITIRVSRKTITRNIRVMKKQKKLLKQNKIRFEEIYNSYHSRIGFVKQYDNPTAVECLQDCYNKLFVNDFISGKELDELI